MGKNAFIWAWPRVPDECKGKNETIHDVDLIPQDTCQLANLNLFYFLTHMNALNLSQTKLQQYHLL